LSNPQQDYINYLNNETKLCAFAFQNIEAGPNGGWSVCCKTPVLYSSKDPEYARVEDFWNSPKMREIRKSMLEGKEHPHCTFCWKNEAVGKTSYRQHTAQRAVGTLGVDLLKKLIEDTDKETGISSVESVKTLEFRISNVCNLKCRMCNPIYSSRWASDWNKLPEEHKNLYRNYEKSYDYDDLVKHPLLSMESDHIKKIFDSVGPNLRKMTLLGGEPMLEEKTYEVLEAVDPYAKNIHFIIITNMTKIERFDEFIKDWKYFSLIISCDGMGKYYEYVRQLASWDNFSNNVRHIREKYPNIQVDVIVTLQIYNYPTILDTVTWLLDTLGTNERSVWLELSIVEGPYFVSLKILPDVLKSRLIEEWSDWVDKVLDDNGIYANRWNSKNRNWVANQFRRVINILKTELAEAPNRRSQLYQTTRMFVNYSDRLDKVQNVKIPWRELLPELAEEIKNIKP